MNRLITLAIAALLILTVQSCTKTEHCDCYDPNNINAPHDAINIKSRNVSKAADECKKHRPGYTCVLM